jgi:hypothetical protein
MKTSKLISLLKILLLSCTLMLASAASAGYLVNYQGDGYSGGGCVSCCKNCPPHHRYYRHHYRHHYYGHRRCYTRAHSRSHYEISVYYVESPYPDYYTMDNCGCQQRNPCASRCQVHESRAYYAPAPARWVDTCNSCHQDISYDRATADDTHEY